MHKLRSRLLLLRSDDLHTGRLRHLSIQLLLQFIQVKHLRLCGLRPLNVCPGLLSRTCWSSLHRLLTIIGLNYHTVLIVQLHRDLMQLLSLLLDILSLQLIELRLVETLRILRRHQLLFQLRLTRQIHNQLLRLHLLHASPGSSLTARSSNRVESHGLADRLRRLLL